MGEIESYENNKKAQLPTGELALRSLAMPADTNPDGDIFGGWLLSQMDMAGGIAARQKTRGRVATIAIDAMKFHKPVSVGDVLCCYTSLVKTGRTSITYHVQAWVLRANIHQTQERELVTEGRFTFVAIDEHRQKRLIET